MSNPLATGLGKEFASETATVNGGRFTTFVGANGLPSILIHGFPQDWFEYHAIMPRLAKRFTVIAVDLCGAGGSTATAGGYDAANMAKDGSSACVDTQPRCGLRRARSKEECLTCVP